MITKRNTLVVSSERFVYGFRTALEQFFSSKSMRSDISHALPLSNVVRVYKIIYNQPVQKSTLELARLFQSCQAYSSTLAIGSPSWISVAARSNKLPYTVIRFRVFLSIRHSTLRALQNNNSYSTLPNRKAVHCYPPL